VDERAAHERVKKELTILKLQREKGELVPRYQAVEWLETIGEAKVALLGLPRRLAPPSYCSRKKGGLIPTPGRDQKDLKELGVRQMAVRKRKEPLRIE